MFGEKQNQPPPRPPQWNKSLATFLEDYKPAASVADSDKQFTTQEIRQMLEGHTGETIETTDLVEALEAIGFGYTRTGDLQLEWLMKKADGNY